LVDNPTVRIGIIVVSFTRKPMSIEEIDTFWACGISQGVLDISMVA
jgi:hypothetical protein